MTHIDTAELYGSGKVEAIVGKAIADRRDEVYLVSKVMPSHASRQGTVRACEKSLRLLRTDRLDCYLLHWPGAEPLEDTIAAFEQLQTEGKILSFGVSNFDADELAQAVSIAGVGRIACNQVLYHLGERGIEHEVIPYCEAHGIAVVGYSPFGSGEFPPRGKASLRALEDVASRHGATPRQVALAFLTRAPHLFAIPKASQLAHVEENGAAARITLDDRDLAALEAAFPVGPRRAGVAML